MTETRRGPWPVALFVAFAAALCGYGILFVQPWATLTSSVVSLVGLALMRRYRRREMTRPE